ncbi:hypothetical protein BAZO_11575, partial [Schinkia azotoformans LMG 9581]
MTHFNPRIRVGCDPDGTLWDGRYLEFQSTHPRGMRLHSDKFYRYPLFISIHASAWDATFGNYIAGEAGAISIHASAWDATLLMSIIPHLNSISIHAS